MIQSEASKKFKANKKIKAENKTKRGKIESDDTKKERLSKDVRYQEFAEMTLNRMCKETSVKGHFSFMMFSTPTRVFFYFQYLHIL